MFIDAFVSSVGPVYAEYMARSLPVWADTLDSLTVVTMPGDPVCEVARRFRRVRVVETDVFKQFGAAFNKGAALNYAYAHMDPSDVVLHFDADIEPPPDWRQKAEKEFRSGTIAGALRTDEGGKRIEDAGSWPYGYFQMWHVLDPVVACWPLLEVWHPSAGGYDLEFLEKWDKRSWRKLSFDVKHYGEVRRNWFGVGLPEEEQQESFRKMDAVHKVGLRETRMRTRRSENRLRVPAPLANFALPSEDNRDRLLALVRACLTDDPFLLTCTPSSSKALKGLRGVQPIKRRTDPRVLRKRVVDLYRSKHKRDPVICPAGFDA